MAVPVLVINRECDTDRLERFRASAERHGVDHEVVPAFDAHRPDFPFAAHAGLIGDRFWGQTRAKPGAIGCFLSHRLAWETVRARGWARALVCEDDAVLHEGTARLAAMADAFPGVEVLFANDRLAAWAAAAGIDPEGAAPLPAIVTRLALRGGPAGLGIKAAPGADAYLVSADGAGRLLEITARHRIVCGVDWAMVRAALPGTDDMAEAFPELGKLRDLTTIPPLLAHVLGKPVAGQAGGLPSTIRHSVTTPIADLKARGLRPPAQRRGDAR